MSESATGELDAVYQRMWKRFREIGPVPDRYERFLTELHGPDWKQRALAAGPPEQSLGYGKRLRDIEARIKHIETHLKLGRTAT
jgi:hypothetical protein